MPHLPATVILGAFWILDPLYTALGTVLAWFYDLIPSYGMAIILLTLAVRLLTFPLTAKQARSQQALQKLQPELKRLQAKYKGDKQKLNEEMMKFYKEHHVNPFGSCLPLFIQFPVLIVLYRLLLGLSRTFIVGFAIVVGAAVTVGGATPGPLDGVSVRGGHVSDGKLKNGVIAEGKLDNAQAVVDGKVIGAVNDAKVVGGKIAIAQVMNGEAVVGTMTDLTLSGGEVAGAPKNVPDDSSLYRSLKADGGKMESFGMDLAKKPSDVSGSDQIPYIVLVLLVGATGFYQQRQLTGRLPKESANSQMALIGKIFPIMFVFISFTIPAGVVVYFLVSNIWQIGQQAVMFRNQPKPEPGPSDAGKSKKGPTPPAGKGKGKATPARRARGATTGKLSKGAKTAGAGAASKRSKAGRNGDKPGTSPPTGKASGKRASGNRVSGSKASGAGSSGNKPPRGPGSQPTDGAPPGARANGNRASGKAKRRTDYGAPRPKGQARRPEPDKPVASSHNNPPPAGSGENGNPAAAKHADAGPLGGSAEKSVDEVPDTTTASPAAPTDTSTPTEPQGSNGSTPLAMPLPPAGDLDKDGE